MNKIINYIKKNFSIYLRIPYYLKKTKFDKPRLYRSEFHVCGKHLETFVYGEKTTKSIVFTAYWNYNPLDKNGRCKNKFRIENREYGNEPDISRAKLLIWNCFRIGFIKEKSIDILLTK